MRDFLTYSHDPDNYDVFDQATFMITFYYTFLYYITNLYS